VRTRAAARGGEEEMITWRNIENHLHAAGMPLAEVVGLSNRWRPRQWEDAEKQAAIYLALEAGLDRVQAERAGEAAFRRALAD
jgi:hypothetical protein